MRIRGRRGGYGSDYAVNWDLVRDGERPLRLALRASHLPWTAVALFREAEARPAGAGIHMDAPRAAAACPAGSSGGA